MFKIKRKSQPPSTLPSSSSINRPTLLVSSSSSACYTRHHHNNVSSSSSTSVSPQCNSYKKISRQQRNDKSSTNTRSSHPKQFLGYFRCCCYHLCSCTCECSIPSNTFQNENYSSKFTRQNCASTSSISSSYIRHHLRHYISERRLIERKTTQKNSFPKFSLLVLLFSSLFPLAIATTLPPTQITTGNHDLYIFGDIGSNSSSIIPLLIRKPQWHAGCCPSPNKTTLEMCDARINSTFSIVDRNYLIGKSSQIDFLNNETLFCRRYSTYRRLSTHFLTTFTYVIVVIGIILNAFVFLVLMWGSLRRSTSFLLFVALTCFDLLSLASSLFSQLFRTVMTYLTGSAIFCKMFGIFFLYFRQCSSTTLLLIAIERCIVIKYPFCRHTFNKFRLLLLALIMIIFVIPIPFDFIFYTSGSVHCEAFDTIEADRYQIFRGFFTVFSYAIVPFVGISISNFLIIIELKKSKQRFMTTDANGTMRRFSTNVVDKRGTTVMLLVASFAFVLLLGPFYVHWCITYLFSNYPQCQYTRNLYENVQVCMGVFNPYLTVIEKGMRESNHAINFILYWATSTRFRMDFKRIVRCLIYRIFGTTVVFLFKHVCFCCTEPSWIVTLERHVSDTTDLDSSYESNRKNHTAYKTSHYYSNFERRRQHQLVKATLLNDSLGTDTNLTPTASLHTLTAHTAKTVRILTWNPHDPMMHQLETKRQAARLAKHPSTSGAI